MLFPSSLPPPPRFTFRSHRIASHRVACTLASSLAVAATSRVRSHSRKETAELLTCSHGLRFWR